MEQFQSKQYLSLAGALTMVTTFVMDGMEQEIGNQKRY